MTPLLWGLLTVLILVAVWAYLTAQRLDRLHIRLDRSRDGLNAALDRRCAVIALTVPSLSARARAVESIRLLPGDIASRCSAEDELRTQVAEHVNDYDAALIDADTRVMLALRFYNDAVRDTRALRLRVGVRALRLAGTAALPEYASLSAVHDV